MNKCIVCKNNTENSIRLNGFDGFCYSSSVEHICSNCLDENTIYTNNGKYLILDDRVYLDKYGFEVYELVGRKEQLPYLINQKYRYLYV
jgi:hypothetical protein